MNSRRTLWILMLVFFGPLLLASALYYTSGWRPEGHTNHGTLIDPPRPLAAAVFKGKWSMVYVGAGTCDERCQHTLYYMRQSHLGLGRLYARAQRVFVQTAPCCNSALRHDYPDLVTVDASAATMRALLQQFPAPRRATSIFIVDPRGNLMMQYDSADPPGGLIDDLNHLLGLSSIG
jgi:cytochrome oxidase Cu insertion factor (SCO1/SenC/PrrC family)